MNLHTSHKKFCVAVATIILFAASAFGNPRLLTDSMRDSILRADSVYWTTKLSERPWSWDVGDETKDSLIQELAREYLVAPVYFEPGTTRLRQEDLELIRVKSKLLALNPNTEIKVISSSSTDAGQVIARTQAQAVRRELMLADKKTSQIHIDVARDWDSAFLKSPHRIDFVRQDNAPLHLDNETRERFVKMFESHAPHFAPLERKHKTENVSVRLFYATDRKQSGNATPTDYYGNIQMDSLAWGKVEVTVPISKHTRGRLETRGFWGWLLGFEKHDATRYFVLGNPMEMTRGDWKDSIAQALQASVGRDIFVYINGYNVSFDRAALVTAQLTVDLQLRGVPILYSWPACGGPLQYAADHDASTITAKELAAFIRQLAETAGAQRVNILAHSMGNRALLQAATKLKESRDTLLGEVILAAPDEDQKIFRDAVVGLRAISKRVTLYASSRDKALKLAQGFRQKRPRAGQAGKDLIVLKEIETIDASAVDTDFFAHGYESNSLQVLDDLRLLINLKLPAANRLTDARTRDNITYWWLAPRTY